MLRKIINFLRKNKFEKRVSIVRKLYYLFNKRKFKKFGMKSYIWEPLFLSGTKYYEIGKNVGIWPHARIEAIDKWEGEIFTPRLVIGDNVMIGQDSHITVAKCIEIEKDVVIAPRLLVTDISHMANDTEINVLKQKITTKPVKICEGAFIGSNVTILPGVTIGKHAVVGAGAVVTHDVPDYSTVIGIPARLI